MLSHSKLTSLTSSNCTVLSPNSGLHLLTILLNEKSILDSLALPGKTSSISHVCILVSSLSLMRAMSVDGFIVGSKRRVSVTVDKVVKMNSSTEDSVRVERTEVDNKVLDSVRRDAVVEVAVACILERGGSR